METRTLPFDTKSIDEASRLILAGEPVAVPTETVYGLGADATNPEAVARIYEAKGRPSFNPLIVHVPSFEAARLLGDFNAQAAELAKQHWPGPLTLVVPLRVDAGIASIVTAGLPNIGIRVPAHPAMQALLRATDRPLAAPSANSSGSISPTSAEHVLRTLAGRIPLIIDGGSTQRGLESTIVAATGGRLRLLRPGPISVDAEATYSSKIEAPGQLASHYAPAKPLRLDATTSDVAEFHIGFGAVEGDASLSPAGNLVQAAARLFALLHEADTSNKACIAVAPIPAEGLGVAINDRLRRAAA